MEGVLRESGIDIIGSVPWGTHFCQFYKTKEDLIDTLVPYFKAGLKNNEFCMWVTSDPLSEEEAKEAMREAMPNFDEYVRKGQIEIIPYTDWYLKEGTFNHERVLNGWLEKLNQAMERGYTGLRLTGNTFWLEDYLWKDFTDYELEVNNVIGKYKMLAICTYSLDKCGANEVMDVVNTHQFALIKREGAWRIIESSELKEAKQALRVEIEERKRAEEALRESEQRYATTLASIGDAVIATDVEGRITFMNAVAEELTGWTLSEALTKPVTEVFNIINEYTRAEVEGPVTRVLQEGGIIGLANHTILVRKDGTEAPIDDSGAPIRDGGGKTIGVVLVFRDIIERKHAEEALRIAYDELEIRVQERTSELEEANVELEIEIAERKRAEEALLESETKYRELAESIGEVFYALDRNLRYTYWNNASFALTGISAKDAIGKSLFELFPELKGSRAEKLYTEVLKTQQPQSFVHKYRVGDKNLFFEINAYPSKFGLSVIAKDITERKRAEKQIYDQASLLDKAQDAIGVRDLEHRLIYWNKGAQRLYGWTADEVIGKNADGLVYKKESPLLIQAKKSVIERGEWTGELHQITKDKKEIIVESRWSLIRNGEGKPKSILIINTDITEKKKLEAQLLRAQRMESIGTLAGGIAHDLNNLMTPMMLSLQMLKQKFTDEQSQKLLSILERNSQRGANLIKQVLSFARGIEGERNPLQVGQIISDIEKIAKETFPRNIEIRTDIKKDLFTISGDATQLHQVIMNLCVNSRDAMPDGGILSITASNFLIDEDFARMLPDANVGQYVVIWVSDTGTGISPEILDRIFEPFFTTKEHGKGTGLGLSTSHAIVKSYGGFINVYSEVGEGTTFKVYLPAIKTELQEVQEQKLELPIGQQELILVVDDEATIREVTCSTLEACGYRVITANDGADAVALYSQNIEETRVVLMDMAMPNMDGLASIRILRKINPKVKIIAASGLAEKEKLAKVVDINANAFLPKPYTAEKLLKTIHEVLSTNVNIYATQHQNPEV
ncbi:PAS domain S-box [Candidatus Methanoperedens nitroreducens]|uniref:PAS domain S-box n=2 Tax=Candidatus Methanoperedens nitratireducens TaxID=1392998 RepID=A0A062V4A0_9EURY|nr:PAS domain S-box [Candidatus Methanoperedens nitroreducens]